MKRFQFPLERWRQLKIRQQKQADVERLRAQARRDSIRNKLNEAYRQLEELAAESPRRHNNLTVCDDYLMHCRLGDQIRLCIGTWQQELREAERTFREAATRYTNVSREVEALQSLRDTEWQRYRKLVERVKQQQLDEHVLRRWQTPTER